MSRARSVKITGSVLRWFLRGAGLTEDEFARKLKVSPEVIRAWEDDKANPSLTQFRKLVQVLKRPSAAFFLPEPPHITRPAAEFRKPPDREGRDLLPNEANWIRAAKRVQSFVSTVAAKIDEPLPALKEAHTSNPPEDIANEARQSVGVSVLVQKSWADSSVALKEWRSALESRGVLVFQVRLGRESCQGFSLWEKRAPIIVANTAYNPPARIFTLFHEYGHLLTRTDSVCTPWHGRFDNLESVERWHERFAAAFLMPREPFLDELAQRGWRPGRYVDDFDSVRSVASDFKVSLRATAVRMIEVGAAAPELYTEVAQRARLVEVGRKGRGGRGLTKSELRIQEFGQRLPRILLAARKKGAVKVHEILDHMDVGPSNLYELERMLET
jgi:Zn-dependent peptidase ImmA (M78 family)/transcriptional regulator with XRE-family HTH domain